MDENEAKVEGASLIIGDTFTKVLRDTQPTASTVPLLDEIAKRWNAYTKMIEFLGDAEYVFNAAIMRTPTGDVRNKCTELNIKRMAFITGEPAKPVEEVSNEGP